MNSFKVTRYLIGKYYERMFAFKHLIFGSNLNESDLNTFYNDDNCNMIDSLL